MPVSKSYKARLFKGVGEVINYPTSDPAEPPLEKSYALLNLDGSVTHDGGVPQWRLKCSIGENATSFMTGSRRKVNIENGHFAVSYQPPGLPVYYWTIITGDLCDSYVVNDADLPLTAADNQAKAKFVKHCLSELQAIEGQVFLGELRETLHLIKHPLQSFRRSLDLYHNALRRRRKGSRRHRERVVSDTWLEFQYGWGPLISDIESGVEALRRFSRTPVRFKPVRAQGKTTTLLDQQNFGVSVGGFGYNIEHIASFEANVRYYGAVDLATQGLDVVTSNLGLRFDRFVPTLWELLPYSFLADYFTNIGDIISSWSWGNFGLRWSSRGAMKNTIVKRSTSSPFLFGIGPGTYNWTGREPGKSHSEHRVIVRTTYGGNFIPDFRLEIPGMSSTKWLNIAALLDARRSLRPF